MKCLFFFLFLFIKTISWFDFSDQNTDTKLNLFHNFHLKPGIFLILTFWIFNFFFTLASVILFKPFSRHWTQNCIHDHLVNFSISVLGNELQRNVFRLCDHDYIKVQKCANFPLLTTTATGALSDYMFNKCPETQKLTSTSWNSCYLAAVLCVNKIGCLLLHYNT